MDFCTQCGNSIEAEARFCGKCGSELKKQLLSRDTIPASPAKNVVSEKTNSSNVNKKNQKYNMKFIVAAIAVILIIGYYLMSPKQLTEREYEELAIQLLVQDTLALENFSHEIEYSGIYMGMEPDWSEEYKVLIKPAKMLEKDFSNLSKKLEDVKPPKYFEYEHENLLKVFNSHQNMASNIVSYMSNGGEEYMESSEEYEDRADEYLEESIFFTDKYEEQIMRAYQRSGMD